MKKLLIFAILALFAVACSQYTCPTYSKKEVPSSTPARKI